MLRVLGLMAEEMRDGAYDSIRGMKRTLRHSTPIIIVAVLVLVSALSSAVF